MGTSHGQLSTGDVHLLCDSSVGQLLVWHATAGSQRPCEHGKLLVWRAAARGYVNVVNLKSGKLRLAARGHVNMVNCQFGELRRRQPYPRSLLMYTTCPSPGARSKK